MVRIVFCIGAPGATFGRSTAVPSIPSVSRLGSKSAGTAGKAVVGQIRIDVAHRLASIRAIAGVRRSCSRQRALVGPMLPTAISMVEAMMS